MTCGVFARRLALGHVRLLLVTVRLGHIEFSLISVQLVLTIRGIVPPFATHSAHWDRLLVHWGSAACTLGTRCVAAQLRRERLDLGVLSLALGFLSLGSRLECSQFSCGILSRDLHLSRKNLGLGDPSSVAARCRCCSHRLIAASVSSMVIMCS